MFRILVHRFFGVETWSQHGDGHNHDFGDMLADVVGFVPHDPLGAPQLAEMAAKHGFSLVKTHNLPPDDASAAIYIVRDGRSSVTSYWHYRNRPGDVGATLGDAVAGRVQFGSWSAHVAAWLDAPLPRRLVVRYEDLVAAPVASMAEVGAFLGLTPLDATAPDFAELKALAPQHFRVGSDAANVAELEARCPALFNAFHGAMQTRLGYQAASVAGDPTDTLMREVAACLNEAEGVGRARASSDAASHLANANALANNLASDLANANTLADNLASDLANANALADALSNDLARAKSRVSNLANDLADANNLADDLSKDLAVAKLDIRAMRQSPFWKARDATVGVLRASGLRRRA